MATTLSMNQPSPHPSPIGWERVLPPWRERAGTCLPFAMSDSWKLARNLIAGRSLLVLVIFLVGARSAAAQYDPDWSRHLRLGGLLGFNIKADFKTGGALDVNSRPGIYDNGYVLTDSTGNEGGVTTYFGYDTAGQYNRGANTLTFQDTTKFASYPGQNTSLEQKDGGPFAGAELVYGENLYYWKRVRIGWDFGFGFMPIKMSANQSMTGAVEQVTYTYDTTGVFLPPGPYHAPSGTTGPWQIPATPASSTTNNIGGAVLTGTQTLDVMLYTFRLGPTIYWDLNPKVGMSISGGPAFGVVSGDLEWNETVTTDTSAKYKGKVSGTDVVYGGYVNATIMYHATKNGDLYIGAQYMPLGKATISGNGREGTLDLRGAIYFTAGINWPF
jgi:hypothetical protein